MTRQTRVTAAVCGLVGLVVLGLAFGGALRTDPDEPPLVIPSPLVVEATGHEFLWNFRYPGADGEFDTADDVRVEQVLHLPMGTDVVLRLRSDDYVYTLSIPELKLREIAVPELLFTLKFRTTQAGTYDVIADPLCAVRWLHDDDMGRVVIESREAFASWYRQRQKG